MLQSDFQIPLESGDLLTAVLALVWWRLKRLEDDVKDVRERINDGEKP